MPAKQFTIPKGVNKRILKFPSKVQKRVRLSFKQLKENPLSGEKLHGELKDYYKYRVGDYRIVYQFNAKESTLTVVKIEHRRGVYR